MADFRMPSLGADMDAGMLVAWLKRPGDPIARGDIVAVVETQKGAIEIESFQSGTLRDICVEPGQKVPVGTVLAHIDGPEAAEPTMLPAAPSPPTVPPRAPAPAALPTTAPREERGARGRISPLARRRATELGLDPAALRGSGFDGAVTRADVERAAKERPRGPVAAGSEIRRAIAAAMSRSKREIPHYYLSATLDASACLDWLERENAKRPVAARLLYVVPILKAVALALHAVPELNGTYSEGLFRPSSDVHLGMAIALRGGGLIAPALHHADRCDLDGLMRALGDLVRRARTGGLKSSELSDPTVTVTNLGEGIVDAVYPVIYPPQVAMIGLGSVMKRPWIVDDAIVPRRLIQVSVAADHRVSDGHRAARFLETLGQFLAEPDKL